MAKTFSTIGIDTMRIFVLLSLLASISMSNAAVWNADKEWTVDFEKEYSQWMASSAVYPTMFRDKKSKYYGISADCADAAYALKAIFAYENSLPFAVVLPTGSRKKKTFSNKQTRFDKYGPENKRLVAMINYLADVVGSESLTFNDTYPIALKTIAPSALFTYKIKARFGKRIRHVYTIKDVTINGNFDLIYSTQAIRKKKMPMNYRKSKALVNAPQGNWGFRRLKWPRLLYASSSQYPVELGYSREQYSATQGRSTSQFFRYVKDQLKIEDETPDMVVSRATRSLCEEAQARIKYVEQGVEHNLATRRCMNYEDFDTFSTPARDKGLKEVYSSLFEELRALSEAGESFVVNEDLSDLAVTIFRYRNASLEAKAQLLKFCPIEYTKGKTIDLGELFTRLQKGLLSSHPNDNIYRRWGERVGKKTRCKRHY